MKYIFMKYIFAFCLTALPLVAQESRPLTLRALFDSVAATHPLVRAAAARTRAAQGARITAGSLGNPVLSYEVDRAPTVGGPPMPGGDREVMTMVMLPLEPLYQRQPRVQAADATVRAAAADADATRQRTALDAAEAYYRTALAQVGAATARDLAAWFDTLVTYNRARVNEGAAAEADLLRSQIERDRAAADVTMEEVDLARARAALAAFLGDPRMVAPPMVVLSDRPLMFETTRTAMPADFALERRPDVRAAQNRADASRAAAAGEQTMILRQLGAMIGTQQMFGTTSLVVGVTLPLPLFDTNRGEIRRTAAERDAAAFELAAAEHAAAADQVGAREIARLLSLRADSLTAGGADGFLARADEARRIALGAYREGAVPLLAVLDAARAWGDARMTFYRTLYAQHQSVLLLLAAQGADLFTNLPAPAEPRALNR